MALLYPAPEAEPPDPEPQAASPRLRAAPTAVASNPRWSREFRSLIGAALLSAGGFRVEGVAQPVAEQVEREHGDADSQAGHEHEPGDGLIDRDGGGEPLSPGRGRRVNAHPEVVQRRLEQDVLRDQQGG